jgi:hypothetical protein
MKNKKDFENINEDIQNEPLPAKLSKLNKSNLDVVNVRPRNQTEITGKDSDVLDEKDDSE